MMFKEVYQRKNDAVHAREDLLDEIKTEQVVRERIEQKKKDRRRQWMIAIPAVAAAAVACVAIVVGINTGRMKNSAAPAEDRAAAASYMVLPFADCEMVFHPLAEGVVVHIVHELLIIMHGAVRRDELYPLHGEGGVKLGYLLRPRHLEKIPRFADAAPVGREHIVLQ